MYLVRETIPFIGAVLALVLIVELTYDEPDVTPTEIVLEEIVVPKLEPRKVIDYNQVECMALNIYHEARNESVEGQIAVGNVTLNRVLDSKFPNTICDVVYQAKLSSWWKKEHDREVPVKHQCQFSWYCDGKSDRIREERAYAKIKKLSYDIIDGRYDDNTYGSTYYHAHYVSPKWAKSFVKVAMIENHIFYVSNR